MMNLYEHPHRRYNPLTGEWVLVSPHRAKRPWQGQKEAISEENKPEYEPGCYLCPGNTRNGGIKNPNYSDTFVFTNDFSAMLEDTPIDGISENELFVAKGEQGICRVICFSPSHHLTIPEMDLNDIEKVIRLWQNEYNEIGRKEFINYIQIFENKGAIMGCSNPHPHGQIWAQSSIPVEIEKEIKHQSAFYNRTGIPLLQEYLDIELSKKERIVEENKTFVALVPYWAIWPFETMIIPKRHVQHITQLRSEEVSGFADMYKNLTTRYDNLFNISFPYSAGIHQSPTDGNEHPEWQMHMHFYPPLLRSATVKKFMVGYEMLANAQRDITPEQSAERLRNMNTKHYKQIKI